MGLHDCHSCGETGLPVFNGCQYVCSSCSSDRIVENLTATDCTVDKLPEVVK